MTSHINLERMPDLDTTCCNPCSNRLLAHLQFELLVSHLQWNGQVLSLEELKIVTYLYVTVVLKDVLHVSIPQPVLLPLSIGVFLVGRN